MELLIKLMEVENFEKFYLDGTTLLSLLNYHKKIPNYNYKLEFGILHIRCD